MTIIYSDNTAKVKVPKTHKHDPDSEVTYSIAWGAPLREDTKAYIQGIDVVRASTPNGCIYECVSGGISGTGTTMLTLENKTFDDGDVTWKCLPNTMTLHAGDVLTASTWTGDTGVTLSDMTTTDSIIASVKVTAIPDGATSFEITNTVDILYATGRTEKRQKTLIIQVAEL